MTAADKIAQSRTRLTFARPWFASLLLHLQVMERAEVETMATDGRHLYYAPEFVDGLTPALIDGVLCHEVLHCALLHMIRRGGRDAQLWNIAADAAINAILAAEGIALPRDAIPGWEDPQASAEDIYEEMKKSAKKIKLPMKDLIAALEELSPAEVKAVASTWRRAVAQVAGLLPGSMKRQIEDAQATRTPWQELLAQFVASTVPADHHTWTRVSRRLPGAMPGWVRTPAPVLGLAIDTSGSIGGPVLDQFLAECQAILALHGVSAYVVAADAAVGQIIEPGQPLPRELPGGGGTDFRPALASCEARRDIVAVVYFTDGEGQYPAGCTLPVLWALTARRITPPFGQHVYLSQSEKGN